MTMDNRGKIGGMHRFNLHLPYERYCLMESAAERKNESVTKWMINWLGYGLKMEGSVNQSPEAIKATIAALEQTEQQKVSELQFQTAAVKTEYAQKLAELHKELALAEQLAQDAPAREKVRIEQEKEFWAWFRNKYNPANPLPENLEPTIQEAFAGVGNDGKEYTRQVKIEAPAIKALHKAQKLGVTISAQELLQVSGMPEESYATFLRNRLNEPQ